MLSKYFDLENIKIISKNEFKMYPKASERSFWDNLSDELKNQLIVSAEKYYKYQFPSIQMSDYMKFERCGDRTSYELPFKERRDALCALVLAECAEYKGRFIDDIINVIYHICDEVSWVVHAHNYKDIRYGTHDGNNTYLIAHEDTIVIDLWSSMTSHYLADAYYFLKDELDNISPFICRRIENKIEERMVSLYEKYDEYFWKSETNNWNPHCNYHCLAAAMVMIDDDDRRRNFVKKLLKSINIYINSYRNDGGCDEGAIYWSGSCANLFQALNLLKYVSFEKINVFAEEKIKNMAAFPVNMYIGDGRFINSADCISYAMSPFNVLYNFGVATGNKDLMALSVLAKKENAICTSIDAVTAFDNIDNTDDSISYTDEYFYPDLQIAIFRENTPSGDVLFAAKGGHNNESHNHCDVGSFMLYKNNKPVVADPGTDQYVSASFTPQRYSIWYNNSLHHNVPSVNGKMQKNGPRYDGVVMPQEKLVAPMYCASDVKYETDSFSLDISGTYGDENIKKWKREFYFDRNNKSLVVTEDYELSEESSIELVFMLAEKPEIQNDRVLLAEGVVLNKGELEANCRQITDMGAKMVKQWGGMYRLSLTAKGKAGKINYSFNW